MEGITLDSDEEFARRLQEEFDRDAAEQIQGSTFLNNNVKKKHDSDNHHSFQACSGSKLSPVDPSLEFTDPNPDIRILFLHFNEEYFWGKLSGIEVKWSPRMTLCAGLCVYEGHGGLCSVRLSQPLLKLRPRKDLVETLLHEMIHAYLFITDNNRDHDGHGPQFQKHMLRINKATGAHITIYHNFHDEVEAYQQHWWRCNGVCQNRKPFFGYVKRAMNRAPSSNDFWWAEHRVTCGGTFTKIKEPENNGKKVGKKNKEKKSDSNIQHFMDKGQSSSQSHKSVDGKKDLFQTIGNNQIKKTDLQTGGLLSKRSPSVNSSVFKGNLNINSSANKSKSSKPAIVGGVLMPKSFLKQSTLFSTVGTARNHNSKIIPSSGPSHSVLSSRSGNIISVSDKDAQKHEQDGKNININHDLLKREDKNEFKSPSSKHNSSNKKKGKLNKFHSVCEGGDGTLTIKKFTNSVKQKEYIFDELDTNEGLWDITTDTGKSKAKYVHSSSTQSSLVQETITSQKTEISSPKRRENKFKSENDFGKCEMKEPNLRSPEQSKYYFPGKGYRLGEGEKRSMNKQGSSKGSDCYMNGLIDNKESERTFERESTDKAFIFEETNKSSSWIENSVTGKKRSFHKAFPSTSFALSDEDEEIQSVNSAKSIRANEDEADDCLPLDAIQRNHEHKNTMSRSLNQPSLNAGENAKNIVDCPVCGTKISHDMINSHLDMCLHG